jgi:hypothetical protein
MNATRSIVVNPLVTFLVFGALQVAVFVAIFAACPN